MGRTQNGFCWHRIHKKLILPVLFFMISSSTTQVRCIAEGRTTFRLTGHVQRTEEEKMSLRTQIGSRPPRCERRCSSCGHCEAIQVPTNPQVRIVGTSTNSSSSTSRIAYAGGDGDASNYKPMSWKCKCGDSIFNP